METWYLPNDLKFLVEITASGFSMDDNDWRVGVKCGSKIVKTYNKSECVKGEDGNWYVCIEKSILKKGEFALIGYAEVLDPDFEDGIRSEADKVRIGRIESI